MKATATTLFLVLMFIPLCSQNIKGIIIDDQKRPIPDAIIFSNDQLKHTHSDINGRFIFKQVEVGDTLNVQFLGFEKYTRLVGTEDFSEDVFIILTETKFELEQIYIDNSLKSINTVNQVDLQINPVNSSQDILKKVPGLFIAQHAGGGKAEQIFLRGFDLDHGTDIAITVDGMPVNMVSHAHGQGYADLHFLIPETVDKIDFGKGTYYADKGNLNTAGYVEFKTKDKIEENIIGLDVGEFSTFRTFGLVDLVSTDHSNIYLASEWMSSDGPFESPQNFNRLNMMVKMSHQNLKGDKLSIQASRFSSRWDASGQIPQRLLNNSTITRFGYVDNTEGGQTSRNNYSFQLTKLINDQSFNKLNAYYIEYDFELYSNFTFFLDDPINGDQIRQKEKRKVFGFDNTFVKEYLLDDINIELSAGIGLRYDDIDDIELTKTKNRQEILHRIRYGDVNESNLYGFINPLFQIGKWTINPSIRFDRFDFQYDDFLSGQYSNISRSQSLASPKFNLFYNPNFNSQIYLKSGLGFHSNDSRLVAFQESEEILPVAYSIDLGAIWKPNPNLWLNTALWYLQLDQEFVYVGDAGIVEPSGRSRRKGIELSVRYQIDKSFYIFTDVNYTIARAIDEESGFDYIPLAPDLTAAVGVNYQLKDNFHIGVKSRYIKNRPADQDNSIIALGYLITDLNIGYNLLTNINVGLTIENLFNKEWNEAQFATLSRLQNEPKAVEEIHFTPGVPRFLKANLKYSF